MTNRAMFKFSLLSDFHKTAFDKFVEYFKLNSSCIFICGVYFVGARSLCFLGFVFCGGAAATLNGLF